MHPVILAVLAVALLLGLVLVVRLHAFAALLLTSLVVAVAMAGLEFSMGRRFLAGWLTTILSVGLI